MKSFKTILFDLDGTITDPFDGITNSVIYALKKHSITPPGKKELGCFIGPPLYATFMEMFSMSREEALEAVNDYREYYADKGIFECELYPGIKELLAKLKADGKKVVLATSKPEIYANKLLQHFGIEACFDLVVGATMDSKIVEKDDIIKIALQNEDAASAVMIGDRKFDILGAKKNGIASIGITYGYGGREELEEANADYICDSVNELIKILL